MQPGAAAALAGPGSPALSAEAPTGPLAGVRVIDLTGVIFGAYATQMLGDLGADILKVEAPPSAEDPGGDVMRWAGEGPEGAPPGLGPIFLTVNRNKRSLALDLRTPADLAELKALIPTCDVFVSTIRMEGLARLGLDEAGVRALRPDVIYAHGSGFGAEGPYGGLPAYDDLIQAACGLADLASLSDRDPTPRLVPALLADKTAGLFLTQAILAALYHRARTGEGQAVEVPMFEALVTFTLAEHLFGHVYDPPTGPYGYPRATTAHRRPYPTADGWIGLLPYSDRHWRDLFALARWEETVARDPRFAAPDARRQHLPELYALLAGATPARTTAAWLEACRARDIPAAPFNRLDALRDDPHLEAVGLFEAREHPHAGPYVSMRPPVRFSRTPLAVTRDAPLLGEHTAEMRGG